jgi:protein-S-isoprenylcysteine O-methyltransferase Ste14
MMERKRSTLAPLVLATLLLLLGVKALSHGKLQHWLVPDFAASGWSAKLVGVLFVALAVVTLIDCFRRSR